MSSTIALVNEPTSLPLWLFQPSQYPKSWELRRSKATALRQHFSGMLLCEGIDIEAREELPFLTELASYSAAYCERRGEQERLNADVRYLQWRLSKLSSSHTEGGGFQDDSGNFVASGDYIAPVSELLESKSKERLHAYANLLGVCRSVQKLPVNDLLRALKRFEVKGDSILHSCLTETQDVLAEEGRNQVVLSAACADEEFLQLMGEEFYSANTSQEFEASPTGSVSDDCFDSWEKIKTRFLNLDLSTTNAHTLCASFVKESESGWSVGEGSAEGDTFKEIARHAALKLGYSGDEGWGFWLQHIRLFGVGYHPIHDSSSNGDDQTQWDGYIENACKVSAQYCEQVRNDELTRKTISERSKPISDMSEAELAELILLPEGAAPQVKPRFPWSEAFEARDQFYFDFSARLDQGRHGAATVGADQPTNNLLASEYSLVQEGEIWRIRFGTEHCTLPDSVGLKYLAILMRQAGQSIDVRRLVALANADGCKEVLSSREVETEELHASEDPYEPLIDEKAKKQYKTRARELADMMAEAKSMGNSAMSESCLEELGNIEKILNDSTGLHGRPRQFSNELERARTSVKKAIDRAVGKFDRRCPGLFDHFKKNLVTGISPIYSDTILHWIL